MRGLAAPYRQRHPERTAFYQCLQDYWEEFRESYRYFYERDYGPLHPVVERTVDRFSECGILGHGLARIRCPECRQEYLLAFSCKTRSFCPSCQAKRVGAFGEWVTGEILQEVPHRQLVWTIPKITIQPQKNLSLPDLPRTGLPEHFDSAKEWLFSRNASGNVRPDREVETPHGTFGIAVDEEQQELFLTVQHRNAVVA